MVIETSTSHQSDIASPALTQHHSTYTVLLQTLRTRLLAIYILNLVVGSITATHSDQLWVSNNYCKNYNKKVTIYVIITNPLWLDTNIMIL